MIERCDMPSQVLRSIRTLPFFLILSVFKLWCRDRSIQYQANASHLESLPSHISLSIIEYIMKTFSDCSSVLSLAMSRRDAVLCHLQAMIDSVIGALSIVDHRGRVLAFRSTTFLYCQGVVRWVGRDSCQACPPTGNRLWRLCVHVSSASNDVIVLEPPSFE
jgi:hypothetical protein